MEDAIIISDIHLGSDVCQAKYLEDFLQNIETRTHELILNGDVFDSWDFRRLKKHHWRVLSAIRSLSDKIKITWINGNHDGPSEIVSHLLGVEVTEEYTLESGGRAILVLHGHTFDEFISDHPWVTHIADCVYRIIQRIDPSFWLAKFVKKSSKTYLRCSEKIERRAVKYAKLKNLNAVCCGHTHLVVDHPGDIGYFNSGCWTELPCTYLSVKDGIVTVQTYEVQNEKSLVAETRREVEQVQSKVA